MDKFEYITLFEDWYDDLQKKLNTLGSQGWELVSTTTVNRPIAGEKKDKREYIACTLKRRLEDINGQN